MFLALWNYLRGYVIIKVTGFSVERFVNLAVHKGVYIWDVSYTAGGVYMKVSVKGFKMLRTCAQKTKCRIKIIEKKGYPFVAHRYRKRKMFAVGVLFFIGILYVMSSFIWMIDIYGNDRVLSDDILTYFENQDLKLGVFKYKLNKKELESGFLNHFHDISWVNIEIKGTRVVIDLTETLPEQALIDRSSPTDVVATKDGLIDSVTASGGIPLVKEKDVVQKGDLLVSGMLSTELDDGTIQYTYVHAEAEVRAKTYYEINLEIPYVYEEKEYTGETNKKYSLQMFEKNIHLNPFGTSKSFSNYDKITSRTQMKIGENFALPFLWIVDEYREFVPVEKTRSLSQALELSDRMVNSRIIRELPFEADIIEKELQTSETENGIQVKATISSIERIDEQIPINTTRIEEINSETQETLEGESSQ